MHMPNLCKKILALALALALAAGLALAAAAKPCKQPFAEKEFFETGDYSICYRVLPAKGEQVGRIFFIHGMVSSTIYWEGLAGLFSEAGYMCAMIDLPGFGYSTREAADVTPKPREEICVELMEKLAPGEAWIVAGHSMGGGVALNLAILYPEKVEALLLYAAAGGGGGDHGGNSGSGLMGGLSIDARGFLMTLLLRPLLFMPPIVKLLAGAANADFWYGLKYDISKIVDPLKLPGTVTSLLYMGERSTPVDLEKAGALTLPIFLLWAEKDYIVTSDMGAGLTAALPQAESQTMRGGHMFTEQFPRETFERSMAFLEK